MPVPVPDADRRAVLHRVLPAAGLFLFTPAVLALFDRSATVAGVPLLIAFLFGAWLAGIGLTLWLATAERAADRGEQRGEDPAAPPDRA